MSESRPTPQQGGGVMRALAKGAKAGGVATAFQILEDVFAPAKRQAREIREEQARRRVATPAPGDPPGLPVDDPAAIPTGLLGAVLDGGPDEPAVGPDGGALPDPAPSADREQPPDGLVQVM